MRDGRGAGSPPLPEAGSRPCSRRVPLAETLNFTSPAFEAYVTARHFAQSADLYGPIEMLNADTRRYLVFRAAAAENSESIVLGETRGLPRRL